MNVVSTVKFDMSDVRNERKEEIAAQGMQLTTLDPSCAERL